MVLKTTLLATAQANLFTYYNDLFIQKMPPGRLLVWLFAHAGSVSLTLRRFSFIQANLGGGARKDQLLEGNTTHREPVVLAVAVCWVDVGTAEAEAASVGAGVLRARPVVAAATLIAETIAPVAATLK